MTALLLICNSLAAIVLLASFIALQKSMNVRSLGSDGKTISLT